jgi:hypothetical protein
LAMLRQQQRALAPSRGANWRRIFEPAETEQSGEEVLKESQETSHLQRLMKANEDEALGRKPTFICKVCSEGFYLQEALERHQKSSHKGLVATKGKLQRQRLSQKTVSPMKKQLAMRDKDAPANHSAKRIRLKAKDFQVSKETEESAPADVPAKRVRLRAKDFMPSAEADPAGIYHERQVDALCAMHALNNAIGRKWQEPEDMKRALQYYLEESEREGLMERRSDHESPGGWYSSEVLAYAVRSTSMHRVGCVEYTMNLTPLATNSAQIHHCVGAIVNKANEHWLALKSVNGIVWKIDSTMPAPVSMTQEEYGAYIAEYQDAFPIYPAHAMAAENAV